MQRFVVDFEGTYVPLIDVLQLLDAVASIIEPDAGHKPSTDTLAMNISEGRLVGVRHSRLGLVIEEVSTD